MNRRTFLNSSLVLSAASLTDPGSLLSSRHLLKQIGVQFFSLPKMLEKDMPGTLAMLSKMGYREVELYGPYPFSMESAKKRWDTITPSLGFSGSGFFGHSVKEIKALLKKNKLTASSMHTDLDTLEHNMGEMAQAAHELGCEYVVLPFIPDDRRKTLDDYKKMAEAFNKIGESAHTNGIRFGYHNHGYGLKEVNGQMPLKLILDGTDPSLVFFEMDVYWTSAGGVNPVTLLETYKNRYKLMHVKDMKQNAVFSGDGGDPKQWIELFPYMTTAGNGVLNLPLILKKAKEAGVEHFFVEQDMVASPEIALKKSFDYLQGL